MHLNDTIREMIYIAFADNDKHRKPSEPQSTGGTTAMEPVVSGSLCQSCMKRANCSRPGRSAGVWHCEDYF